MAGWVIEERNPSSPESVGTLVMHSDATCPKCGCSWSGSELLGATCPACMLEFAFAGTVADPCSTTDEQLTHLGPYTILEPLGRGGMAVVYKARHDALGRIVALKVLHPECASQAGFPQRFQREGQFLATLAHPHIVGVHDIGCESGTYYLAMEYVEGQTLRRRLDKGLCRGRSRWTCSHSCATRSPVRMTAGLFIAM